MCQDSNRMYKYRIKNVNLIQIYIYIYCQEPCSLLTLFVFPYEEN
jgi:hypothetical protein